MPSGGIVTREEIDAAAARAGVPEGLYEQVIRKESGGRVNAGSGAGAIGPAQLMPDTARGLGVDPYDPLQNLAGGARYLRMQFDRFHTWPLALSAYNSGPAGAEPQGRIEPIKETQDYVATILGWWAHSDKPPTYNDAKGIAGGGGSIVGGVTGAIGDAVGGATGAVTGAVGDAVSGALSPIARPFVAVYNLLVSGNTWIRVGLFVGGGVLVLLGLRVALSGSSITATIAKAAAA